MRVLMLSWEYPPLVHGGLGRHVEALAGAVADLGHEVTVVAPGPAEAAAVRRPGVRVLHPDPSDPVVGLAVGDLHGHVATLGAALARVAVAAGQEASAAGRGIDLVCAHDWVVGQAAVSVSQALRVPLVVTIHATEAGRHQGWLPGELSRSIHATENWLTTIADRTVVCSESMRGDVQQLFGLPDSRVAVVGNGVDLQRWPSGRPVAERDALVVFAGRLEYEKGVQVLLRTVARLRRRVPGVRVVIAGTGTYETELRALATKLRLGRAVSFTGRLDDAGLIEVYQQAAVVAVPSLYEPFGLVALEAAACGAPLVVSEVGGLAEFADGGRVALTVAPDSPAALAHELTRVLTDRDLGEKLATAALESVDVHGWEAVAERTCAVYADVLAERRAGGPAERLPVVEPPLDTNLLKRPTPAV